MLSLEHRVPIGKSRGGEGSRRLTPRTMNLGSEMGGGAVIEGFFKQDGVWKMAFYGYVVIWRCGKGTSFRIRPMFKYQPFHFYKIMLILLHKIALKMMCLVLNKWSILVPLPVYRIMTRGRKEISWGQLH